ncbi:MAG: hypothetical protein HY858_02460 [Candidatus Solibacter usitatus]|nr:hypothetical protein [Candidatus Solibacter usitatus]
MSQFPMLKTGAAAQYPLERESRRGVRVMRFLDGSEQRYAARKERRRWVVRVDQLDEREAAALSEFARRYFETLERFAFTDPADGSVHPQCVLEGERQTVLAGGEWRFGTTLVIAAEEG